MNKIYFGVYLLVIGISSHAHTSSSTVTCKLNPKPETLWSLVQCCTKQPPTSSSCQLYDKKDKYIIVKDNNPKKSDSYLLIPTKKITGIESSEIFKAPFINMWEEANSRAEKLLARPVQHIGMAINSKTGRSQNQLHIHISCVSPQVKKMLANKDQVIPMYPNKPITLTLPPHNHQYEVVKVTSLRGGDSPFHVIQSIPRVKGHMKLQSIAVVRSTHAKNYYVLNTYAHGNNKGMAEELLEQTCGLQK